VVEERWKFTSIVEELLVTFIKEWRMERWSKWLGEVCNIHIRLIKVRFEMMRSEWLEVTIILCIIFEWKIWLSFILKWERWENWLCFIIEWEWREIWLGIIAIYTLIFGSIGIIIARVISEMRWMMRRMVR